jgi:hypothetical protein
MTKQTSILNQGTNSHAEGASSFNAIATDFIAPGVVGTLGNTALVAPMTGNFAVNAQSVPNATTQISAGVAYVRGTPTGSVSQVFRVSDDAIPSSGSTITHASNTSGATRYDWIYISLDPAKLLNPAVDASDVFSYVVSRSTSATTDTGTPPTYNIPLAVVALANNFTTVTNGNITDKRTTAGPGALTLATYNPYKFSVYQAGAASLYMATAGTAYTIKFDTKSYDTSNNFSTSTWLFTAPASGFYYLAAGVGFAAAGTSNYINLNLYKNGSTSMDWLQSSSNAVQSSPRLMCGGAVYQLSAGDTVRVAGTSGIPNLTVNGGIDTTWFTGYFVSAT